MFNLNGTAPRCEHLDQIQPVVPRSQGCPECQTRANDWTGLLICLTCGWVACSDSSPGQHSKGHYEETDHPLAAGTGPGKRWRWCYVHQRLV
ncbi:UBP-type zinc finger domain-containing protein [Actinomadura fulvescens]|uniref:UBP-type zinc finger domain-containing protein n=1 Tax=Actinomadura fulvescens TaxID=46160 RepID=A0ABN3QXP6_9ACTN